MDAAGLLHGLAGRRQDRRLADQQGAENAAEYVGADQLREHLNRPDIVDKAIILASAEQAVREVSGTSFKLADLLAKPVPRFRIVSPARAPRSVAAARKSKSPSRRCPIQ